MDQIDESRDADDEDLQTCIDTSGHRDLDVDSMPAASNEKTSTAR